MLSQDDLEEIAGSYPEKMRNLIKHQVNSMMGIIYSNEGKYRSDKGYRDAMDEVLIQIIKGKFLKE